MKSCDIYFYEMCRRAGADKLAPMVRHMGFGEKFDLPFATQRYGTVPDPQWLEQKYHREWQVYDTINMSIGQGYVLINPLQLAVMASADRHRATGRAAAAQVASRSCRRRNSRSTRTISISSGERWRASSTHGTAAGAKLPLDGIRMAGKTGTAQVHKLSAGERGQRNGEPCGGCATTRCSSPSRRPTTRTTRPRRSSSMAALARPSPRR